MEIILTQNVAGLGRKGEVKVVKEGYFMNFLMPRRLAQKATPEMIKRAQERLEKEVLEKEQLVKNAKQVTEKLDGQVIVVKGKAQGEKLFAAIAPEQIIQSIVDQCKIRLAKDNFPAKMHLKEIGDHQVELKLAQNQIAKITVKIEATLV